MNSFLKKETFKNISYISLGKGLSVLLGLGTISLSARGLGVEQFGVLALFLSIAELANLITLPGFNTILHKSLHHKDYKFYKKAYKYSFSAGVTLGVSTSLLLYFSNKNFHFIETTTENLIYLAIVFVNFRTLEKSEVILSPLKEFKSLAVFSFLSSVVRFIGIGLTSYITKDLFSSIKIYIFSQAILSIISLLFVFKKLSKIKSTSNDQTFTNESFQMSLLALINTGIGQLDRIALYNLSPISLGFYQAGISYPEKLREVFKTLLLAVGNSWLSFGDNEFKKRTKSNFLKMISGMTICSTLLYFSAYLYVPLLLGEEFREATYIAAITGVIIFFKLSNYFLQLRDVVFEKLRRYQVKIVIFRLFYVILLFSLIRKYNINGVLITVALSEILYFSMLYFDFSRNKET
jgi:O-antigen/teichoic acid export membrane protein